MSWNKNTTRDSAIDYALSVLKETNVDFTLEVIGRVTAMGLNDDYNGVDTYPIRKLTYGSKVLIERMERHPDCDFDDTIVTHSFDVTTLPNAWNIDITLEVEGYSNEHF